MNLNTTKKIVRAFNSDVAEKFFNVDELMRLLKEHGEGKSNMQKIFTIYTFILWYEVYFPENTSAKTIDEVHLTQAL